MLATERPSAAGSARLSPLRDPLGEGAQFCGEVLIADREEELLFAPERLVDRAAGEAGGVRDLFERRALEATSCEDVGSRRDQGAPRELTAALGRPPFNRHDTVVSRNHLQDQDTLVYHSYMSVSIDASNSRVRPTRARHRLRNCARRSAGAACRLVEVDLHHVAAKTAETPTRSDAAVEAFAWLGRQASWQSRLAELEAGIGPVEDPPLLHLH